MKLRLPLLVLSSALLFVTGSAAADDDRKGHGAGGVRAENASEQGLDKGKAWAGSKEKEAKPEKEKKEKKEKKER